MLRFDQQDREGKMPKLDMTLPHKLGRDEVKGAKTKYAGDFSDLQEEWDGYTAIFSFSAIRKKAKSLLA